MSNAEEILEFWFGRVEQTHIPSERRTCVWFGHDKKIDQEICEKFVSDYEHALQGEYQEWETNPRGCLALIILFDQIPRHLFPNHAMAYEQDQRALDLALKGIEREFDHGLSLIERVFFYFPLMHSENLEMQSLSIRAYQMLINLAFPETQQVYEQFLKYAIKHYETIKEFGRFPYRNAFLGRPSTEQELKFLRNSVPDENES